MKEENTIIANISEDTELEDCPCCGGSGVKEKGSGYKLTKGLFCRDKDYTK